MVERSNDVKIEVLPNRRPSHGGPHIPNQDGICDLCGNKVVFEEGEIEYMKPETWEGK
jgi:hypothetical protein